MKRFLVAAAGAMVLSSSALAADTVVYSEPSPPAAVVPATYDWSGIYIGGQLGYGWANIDPGSIDADGVLGGVHAGYNFDLGTFVVGAEIDYDFADLQIDGGIGEITAVARGKVKGGFKFDRALPYVTAGIAYAEADTILPAGEIDDIGFAVGGGLDYAVTDNVIVGGEYLYHSFDDFDDTGLDVDVHTFKGKVSFKF